MVTPHPEKYIEIMLYSITLVCNTLLTDLESEMQTDHNWDFINENGPLDVERKADIARMGTDTLAGLNKIDRIVEQFKAGLITADEAIRML